MASIKNSLRKIYTALGGTKSKAKSITGLLDEISTVATPGEGGGPGYDVTQEKATYFDGSLTTTFVDDVYMCSIGNVEFDVDSITVTFEGTEYILPKTECTSWYGSYCYGEVENKEPSFANYPFCIFTGDRLFTPAAGTYSVKIESTKPIQRTVTPTQDFTAAVSMVGPTNFIVSVICPNSDSSWGESDRTYSEVQDAFQSGKLVVFKLLNSDYGVIGFCIAHMGVNGYVGYHTTYNFDNSRIITDMYVRNISINDMGVWVSKGSVSFGK